MAAGDGMAQAGGGGVYGSRAGLLRTVERLRELPERPEVLVVDNGSSDGTAEAVADRRFCGVEVLRMSTNLGAPARNVGVMAARTPYVAFSDDDSLWEPGALGRAAAVFDAYPRLGLVAARTLVGARRAADPINLDMANTPIPAALRADRPPSLHRRRAELRNTVLTAWLRRPLPKAIGATVNLAARAPLDGDCRVALAGALRRMPSALSGRRTLPGRVETAARLTEETP